MRVLVLLPSLLLAACGGGSDGGAEASSGYQGIWYLEQQNVYFEIDQAGKTALYECSVYDGYVRDESLEGEVEGDTLSLIPLDGPARREDYQLSLDNDELTLSFTYETETFDFLLTKEDSLPTFCDGDALEVTFYSPEEAVRSESTAFVVNFDYRLASASEATITLYQIVGDVFYYPIDDIQVSAAGTYSGSMMPIITPIEADDRSEFYLSVEMETEEGIFASVTASDEVAVSLITSHSNAAVSQKPIAVRIQQSPRFFKPTHSQKIPQH